MISQSIFLSVSVSAGQWVRGSTRCILVWKAASYSKPLTELNGLVLSVCVVAAVAKRPLGDSEWLMLLFQQNSAVVIIDHLPVSSESTGWDSVSVRPEHQSILEAFHKCPLSLSENTTWQWFNDQLIMPVTWCHLISFVILLAKARTSAYHQTWCNW